MFLYRRIDAVKLCTDIYLQYLKDKTGLGDMWLGLDWWSGDCGLDPPPGRRSFIDIDHELFSAIILSIPLIQEEQLSISGILLVNRLEY